MPRAVLLSIASLLLSSAGCSDATPGGDDAPTKPPSEYAAPPDGDRVLTPTPGFPGQSQMLAPAYNTTVLAVAGGVDGSVWVAHAEEAGPGTSLADRSFVVERFARPPGDPPGAGAVVAQAMVRHKYLEPHALMRVALCSHPSGEVTLAVFTVIASDATATALALTRFAADGAVLRTAYIDDTGARMIDGHAAYPAGNDLDCASEGEDAFLLATTSDLRLYRVASDLSIAWSAPVMPMTRNLLLQPAYGTRARVVGDGAGGAVTAMTLWKDDRTPFTARFGTELPEVNGDADVLVTRFGPGGRRGAAGLLGGPGAERLGGLGVTGDRVRAVAEVRREKHVDRPNNTLERDIVLLEGDPARNRTERAVAIDLCNDDFVLQALAVSGGGFLVAGNTCGVQVDSGSLVANQTGYLLALGGDGTRQGVAWFTSERDTQVQAMAALPSGDLALAGIRNGPITHTDPSEYSNEGWVDLIAPPAAVARR